MLNNCMTCGDKEQCAKSKEKFKTGAEQTGRIKCHGGVSILC